MTDANIPTVKHCSQCQTPKLVSQFSRDKSKSDGLRTRCKDCDRAYEEKSFRLPNPVIAEKYCSLCKVVKPVTEFYRRRNRPTGFTSKCKDCRNAYHQSYVKTEAGQRTINKAYREQWQKYGKNYSQTEKGRATANRAQRKYSASEHGRRTNRDRHLRKRYGITLAEYEAMFAAQGHRCAICNSEGEGRRFHLDHCHITGNVRAILCHTCNSGLGLFRDDPKRFRLAMEYLLKHKSSF